MNCRNCAIELQPNNGTSSLYCKKCIDYFCSKEYEKYLEEKSNVLEVVEATQSIVEFNKIVKKANKLSHYDGNNALKFLDPRIYHKNGKKRKVKLGKDLMTATQRRAFRLKQAGGSHTQEQWEALKAKYNYKCAHCGEKKKLVRDHILEVCLGGSDDITNIQPLCYKCNFQKEINRQKAKVGGPNVRNSKL